MRQVCDQTGIKPSNINRYKDDFPEYIHYRYNASTMLEFDSRSVPAIQKIFELYRDRSSGRMTTEKVRQALDEFYRIEEPVIEIQERTTNSPQSTNLIGVLPNPLVDYLKAQEGRLERVETQNKLIIDNQSHILENQRKMEVVMNQHLALLSEVARNKMGERKKTFWQRVFGTKNDNTEQQNSQV